MRGKSFLAIALGIGRIPKRLAADLRAEGIVIADDGVPMSLHFVEYRSPRNGFTGRKGLAGYLALTSRRLVAKGYWETTELPLSQLSRDNISYGVRDGDVFWFAIEASDFYDDRSGRIEHRLTTPLAREFKRSLDRVLHVEPSVSAAAIYSEKDALFYCKRDTWATLLVWGIVAGMAAGLMFVSETSQSALEQALAFSGAFVIGGSAIYFWGITYYHLTATHLHLRSGFFHSTISLGSIVRVAPRRWAAGFSYAWSLDTLLIETTHARFGYLVAPDDPSAFVAALEARAPHLKGQASAER